MIVINYERKSIYRQINKIGASCFNIKVIVVCAIHIPK